MTRSKRTFVSTRINLRPRLGCEPSPRRLLYQVWRSRAGEQTCSPAPVAASAEEHVHPRQLSSHRNTERRRGNTWHRTDDRVTAIEFGGGQARLATSGVHRENPAVVDHGFEASSWTQITRQQHSRGRLRYGSDLTDAKCLTPAQIEQYEEGCVFPIRNMSETEAAELRGGSWRARAEDGRPGQGRYAP